VVRVRLDRKATSIVLLVVLGVHDDGQKVLLAVKNMGRRDQRGVARGFSMISSSAGLRKPEFLIVDGATGLEQALAALWGDVPTQRCTVPQAPQPARSRNLSGCMRRSRPTTTT